MTVSLSQGNVITQPLLPRWIETGEFGTRGRSRKMPRLRDDQTRLVWVNERGIMSFQRSQAIEPGDSIPDSVHLLNIALCPWNECLPSVSKCSLHYYLDVARPTDWEMIAIEKWRRQWHPTPVLLPGKSHGRRSLVGCSPWGREESDMTEQLHFHFSLSCIGEGNGNPLPFSCLENPRDRGAWWAAVYGVAQSWTQLK